MKPLVVVVVAADPKVRLAGAVVFVVLSCRGAVAAKGIPVAAVVVVVVVAAPPSLRPPSNMHMMY